MLISCWRPWLFLACCLDVVVVGTLIPPLLQNLQLAANRIVENLDGPLVALGICFLRNLDQRTDSELSSPIASNAFRANSSGSLYDEKDHGVL